MFDTMIDPVALIEVVESTHRQESMLVARRLAAVAALLRHRVAATEQSEPRPGYAVIDGFEHTAAEVAAAMNLSPMAASYLVSDADALHTRLPQIAALLAEGQTDWRTVQLIIRRTDLVTDAELAARLDQSLATRIRNWHSWSRQRIVNAVDATVRGIDPDAARERRESADGERHIGINALDNGMAEVYGTVAAAAAATFDRRLSELAKQVCPGDPRTFDQRRADALAALAQGHRLRCACGQSGCPVSAPAEASACDQGSARVVINVVASEQTVLAKGTQPGYLEGYGVIDAEQVRELATFASLLVADPVTSAQEVLRYQPSAALERAIRCRDLTCRFPGCGRPAGVCDIDHTIAFNHENPAAGGLTTPANLKCLCRQHHRLKTFGAWRDTQLADGTVIWTSPTGRTYKTSPAGDDLFPQPRQAACAAPAPRGRSASKRRKSRITQARSHNRKQRQENDARRELAQARKQEIAARQFRNHARNMLFAFKGAASTSPFCTWINDPREPEELPANWTPDIPAPPPLPDDPPF
ncbi:HNH endonuclease [Mycobacterium ahvazicum]|uniref:HNH endonuclease n=1 Tax=Mycobacterium ahvazicum TaxID=1964395 RepID=A0A2K4YHR5_9MYCO|nr:HNH endonuclease signature motif containing protein [Mycobacterium ahvazicum]SOX56331.1 HNH endonuclease [Mycobacterium ahvazicum]